MLNPLPARVGAPLLALALGALLAALLGGLPGAARADDAHKPTKADIEKALDERMVTVNFEDAELNGVLDFFKAITGIAFAVDEPAREHVARARLSVKLNGLSLRKALSTILKTCGGLWYRVEEDRILIVLKTEQDGG